MRRFSLTRTVWAVVLILSLILGTMLSGCQSKSAPNETPNAESSAPTKKELPSTVGIGTTPTGGAFYVVGTGLAKVISDNSEIKAIVKPMAGANAFNPLLESGELELGLQGMDTTWAYNGGPGYTEKQLKNLRMLLRGNDVPVIGLAVRVDSGINSLKDLKGKRVASGYGGFVVGHQITSAYLESVGLTWDDVKPVPVADAPSAIRALQEGRVDVSFAGATRGPQVVEVDAAVPLKALNYGDIPPDQANNPPTEKTQILQKYLPGARTYFQPKDGFLKSDGTQVTYPMNLTVSAKLSDDAAYEITKVLYENDKELHPIHAFLKGWTQATMFDPNPPAPYHDGAVRFWKEKGLWTPEAESNQKRLLGQ